MKINPNPVSFPLGNIVGTAGSMALPKADIQVALRRHMANDWGDLPEEDWQVNDSSVKTGDRLMSSYKAIDGTEFWIITESDRSVTTILLPNEY